MASMDTPMDIAEEATTVTQLEDPLPTTQTTQTPAEGADNFLIANNRDGVPAKDHMVVT